MRNESQRQPKAPETPELAALLAAARRTDPPGADDELRATAAFRAARDAGAHAARSPWWRRRDDWRPVGGRRGVRSVRLMLSGFVAAAALGGVAVAAGTGALPTPFRDGGKGAPADSVHPTHGTSATPEGHRSGGSGPAPGEDATGQAKPTPGLTVPGKGYGGRGGSASGRDEAALCRVYAKHRDSGKASESAALSRLKAAAGGESDAAVTAYCDALLGRPAPGAKGAPDEPVDPDGGGGSDKDVPASPRGTGRGASAGAAGGGPGDHGTVGRNGAAVG